MPEGCSEIVEWDLRTTRIYLVPPLYTKIFRDHTATKGGSSRKCDIHQEETLDVDFVGDIRKT